MLMRRVIMTLDMSEEEAQTVASAIDDVGIDYGIVSPLTALEDTLRHFSDRRGLQIKVRTPASIKLGGFRSEFNEALRAEDTPED